GIVAINSPQPNSKYDRSSNSISLGTVEQILQRIQFAETNGHHGRGRNHYLQSYFIFDLNNYYNHLLQQHKEAEMVFSSLCEKTSFQLKNFAVSQSYNERMD